MTEIERLKFEYMEFNVPYKYMDKVVVHQPGSGSWIQIFDDENDYETHKSDRFYKSTWSVTYFSDEYIKASYL